ncbi:MAG: hypothetical protein KA314_23585 [Chloroflexi bacterium]|nr:hypothetical protein [Chloroflexota bacterium]
MIFIETPYFTRRIKDLLQDEEYRLLQSILANHPEIGDLIPGGGGLRKIRWGYRSKGKRGGVRISYYWAVAQDRILMLLIYPKNVQDNLSPAQLKMLRQVVEAEFR